MNLRDRGVVPTVCIFEKKLSQLGSSVTINFAALFLGQVTFRDTRIFRFESRVPDVAHIVISFNPIVYLLVTNYSKYLRQYY